MAAAAAERENQRIKDFLRAADDDMQAGNLVAPAQGNALLKFRAALLLDPENAAAKAGIEGGDLVGIAFATFGSVAGGVTGGPLSERLIKKNNLAPAPDAEGGQVDSSTEGEKSESSWLEGVMVVLLVLAVCVALGDVVNRFLFERNFRVPGFLTSMLVGIVITNLSDKFNRPLSQPLQASP